MFHDTEMFNQPLEWDTSEVTNMNYMFYSARIFEQILRWNMTKVKTKFAMFDNNSYTRLIILNS